MQKDTWGVSDVSSFINRQLTETSQINKVVKQCLLSTTEAKDVLPLKASIVAELRKVHVDQPICDANFYKLRSLNDFHHAKDAYLVAVMGLFTNKNYPVWGKDEKAYFAKTIIEEYSANLSEREVRQLVNTRCGVIVDKLMHGDFTCWLADDNQVDGNTAYFNMRNVMGKIDVMVVVKKNFGGKPEFYDQNIKSANKDLVPLKYVKDKDGNTIPLDPAIYGGYGGVQQAYYLNVEYSKGKKRVCQLVGIPTLVATKYQNGEKQAIENFLKTEFSNPIVVSKPVYRHQLIVYKGQLVTIASANEVTNATQLVVDAKFHKLLRFVEKAKAYTNARDAVADFDNICMQFVQHYVQKLEKHYPLYASIKDKVKAFCQNGFDALSAEDKASYIKNLLVVTKRGPERVDMDKNKYGLGGGSGWGRLGGQTIYKNDVVWIDTSLTGYYVKRVGPTGAN